MGMYLGVMSKGMYLGAWRRVRADDELSWEFSWTLQMFLLGPSLRQFTGPGFFSGFRFVTPFLSPKASSNLPWNSYVAFSYHVGLDLK